MSFISHFMSFSRFELTVDSPRLASSSPQVELVPYLMNMRIAEDSTVIDRPSAAVMKIHARWSVLVTTANGGDCPGGTIAG